LPPPDNKYEIHLKQIKESGVDKPIQDLAVKIVKLTKVFEKLSQEMAKSARKPGSGQDPRSPLLENTLKDLSKTLSKLDSKIDKLPQNIQKAVSAGRTAITPVKSATVSQNKDLALLLKQLADTSRRIEKSVSYETGTDDALKAINKVIKELKAPQRSLDEINKNVKELGKATGVSLKRTGPVSSKAQDVELFGKALKNMGTEFEKIRKELKDKIVVSLDLETSKIDKAAQRLGEKSAIEFITQIGYKKGKLGDILSGAIKPKEILLKPPVASEEEYRKKLKKGISAVPFERLKNAPDPAKALKQFADVLKDAEVVIGHNIAGFDIKVLEDHFKRAGIKVEAAVDKYVDTFEAAKAAFPERINHKLEFILKDLEAAGVEIEKFGAGSHDARTDVMAVSELLKALIANTQQAAAVQASIYTNLDKINKSVAAATHDFERVAKEAESLVAGTELLNDDADKMHKHASKTVDAFKKATLEISDLSKVKSSIQASIFKSQLIQPSPSGKPFGMTHPPGTVAPAQTATKLGDLAKSLDKLQNNIVKSLERGMKSGAEILKNEAGKAFQIAPGQAEWEIKIADVRGLRKILASDFREFVSPEATAGEVIDAFKRAFVKTELGVARTPESMAQSVYEEIGSLTAELSKTMGKKVEQLFKDIKQKSVTVGEISKRGDLPVLFKEVALETKAQRELMKNFIKRLAIPAARVGVEGGVSVGTKYGAERALSNFATITTGLEKLAQEMKALGAAPLEFETLMRKVTTAPLRPAAGTKAELETERLAATLIKRVIDLGGGKGEVSKGYRRAISIRGLERGEFTPEQAQSFNVGSQGLEELMAKAAELKVNSLDVAKALDEISFENFYDVLDKVLQAGKVPYLQKQAANIVRFDRNMREVSKTVNDLLGLQPLIKPGRPKRRAYDEATLRVLTKATGELRPEEQKQHILDVGLLWKDLVTRTEKLGEGGVFAGKEYLGSPIATSLDLSDAASSKLKQFNEDMVTNLRSLDKTMIGMSLADIRAAAPFKDFSSIQRQLSYVSNAIAGGLPRGGFESPALLSARERQLTESGIYGAGKTGLNVLTELRNTAQTFEDQIVISGRLAKAFTEITGRLVKPARTLVEGKSISDIEPGIKRITPRGARLKTSSEEEFKRVLSEVTNTFQDVLGVPQRYRGRADIAEIGKEIETVIREHRGKEIEVQTAKITETFLNFFGRKLSTRFGTKGVSVTQRYGELPKGIESIEDVAEFIQKGFKAGVAPGPGLGVAKLPKSVGRMLAEIFDTIPTQAKNEIDELDIFGEEVLADFNKKLRESGNKFVIDLFKDARLGLVTTDEAREQRDIFKTAIRVFREAFGKELPKDTVEAIDFIRDQYKEIIKRPAFEFKPIEARISSRGVAKRGLMPEILEGIVNNLIGTTAGTTTLQDEIAKGALTATEQARKRLNEYMSKLGFEAFEDQFAVYTDVINEFGEKMQSFVAPKFVQITEEPHLYAEWSPEQIAKGLKGARLDFQSMAAMAGVFGEGSKMMQELASSTAITAQEGWELLRAFQMLDPAMKDIRESTMRGLEAVSLSDVKAFEQSTGTVEEFKGTIFDIGKFPTPFKLRLPTTRKGAPAGATEELYIPGPAARGTYEEALLGAQAPTNVARYLDNLIDAAQKVEAIATAAEKGGVGLDEDFQKKFAATIRAELTQSLTETLKRFQEREAAGPTPQNIEYMQQVISGFKQALSAERAVAPIYQEGAAITERGAVEEFERKHVGEFSTILGRISDILIGANPAKLGKDIEGLEAALKSYRQTGRVPAKFDIPYYQNILKRFGGDFEAMMEAFMKRSRLRSEASTVFDIELQAGNLDEFAKSVGISIQESLQEALQQRKETLSKAKISYFKALGESVFGKKKGIEDVFFQRITPAVTGKAISAVTDKTKDLKDLLDAMKAKYVVDLDIPGLSMLVDDIEKLSKSHSEYVVKAKKLGLPVLREGEIGLHPRMAEGISVRTGEQGEITTTLADLIKKQTETFVESIRYPFTGTLSVQPHRARLLDQPLARHAIAVPGAPGFARAGAPAERRDITDLTRIVGTLREFIGVAPTGKEARQYLPEETLSLIERREQAWAEGTAKGAEKANQLTDAIEGLLKVVNAATPSFVNLEQKLDFDGDALFVHTGQVEESRKEIKQHFDALAKDVTGVRTLFRSVFTAVDEGDVSTLSEMADIFSKKHPEEKGFAFLTQPFIKEQVKNLDLGKVMESLFTYTAGAGKKSDVGEEVWKKAVREWSRKFVTTDILPEVFSRLGVEGPTRAAYVEKVGRTEAGIPTKSTTILEKNISRLAEDLVRRQLWEKRYADAVTGQLFKLHTGQTVEGISRVARVSELETGFGRGLAGTGRKGRPSPGFLQKFPEESIALGGRPVQEFATRVNEIMRFVIQKGMDVKHAGVEATGQQILANIGKKGGAEFIRKAMMEAADQWEELADFNAQIENEVKLRLGKFSTEELKKEVKRFEPEIDIVQLTGISREEIINRIISHVNVIATFEELGRQIQRQAVKGLSKQLEREIEELPIGPKKVSMMRDVQAAGGVERFASEKIAQELASESGIAIQKHITTNLQPLYRMRTSMETIATAASRTGIKIEPTQMELPQAGAEGLARDLENAQRSAHVLAEAMAGTGIGGGGRGIHKSLVLSAVQQRYKELEDLQKLEKESQGTVGRLALPFTDLVDANKLAAKVFKEAGAAAGLGGGALGPIPVAENIGEFFDKLVKMQKIVRPKVAEISKLAGLMPIIPEEESLIGRGAVEKYGIKPFDVIKDVLEKEALAKKEEIIPEALEQQARELATAAQKAIAFQATMVEQLRRVTEIMKTVPQQKEYLEQAFPQIKFKEGIARISAAQAEVAKRHEEYAKGIQATTAGEELKKTAGEVTDELTEAINAGLLRTTRKALQYLESQAAGTAAAKEVPLHEIFRASGVQGGGLYGGGSQLEGIIREMVGAPKGSEFLLESTAFRGTALHRRKQREFLAKFPTAEIEKPIEDLSNRITGHIDVLYEEGGKQVVADIKTVYSTAQFERLQEIADEIEQRNITIQEKLGELKAKEPTSQIEKNVVRRLEDYISQVNVYLQGVEGAIGELVIISTLDPTREVVIPIGKFDPSRFRQDLRVVTEARDKIARLIALIQADQPIPEELFADMPKVYDFISKELEKVGSEKFISGLPTRPIGEVQKSSQEIIGRLTEEQDRLFQDISKEYLDMFRSLGGPGVAEGPFKLMFASGAGAAGAPPAAPPPPTPPGAGGPGDGFDDEELRKRIQAILDRMKKGIKPEVPEIYRLIQTLEEALRAGLVARGEGDKQLISAFDDIVNTIRAAIEGIGASEEAYREIFELYAKLNETKRTGVAAGADFTRLRTPDIERISPDDPDAMHKNLRALYEAALRVHRLAGDEEIQRFGPTIAALLGEAAKKGPMGDITGQISDAISQLPPEERGGMRRIWMFYKRAVSEYFLNRLDILREEIEEEVGTPEGRRALIEYEQTIDKFLANIRGTVGRMSDIFTQIGSSGKKTEFVDPELARLTGVYRTPKQIEEFVKQTTPMSGRLKPIMDILVGDLDPTMLEDIASPIEKVQAAFRMLTEEDKGLKAILADSELFARIGNEAVDAWDFKKLTNGITELRAALQSYNRLQIGGFGGVTDYTESIRKNVEDTVRYLRQVEQMFAPTGGKGFIPGAAGVPQFLGPDTQRLLHRRNIALVRDLFKTPEAAGGPERGQSFTYRYKIVDPATKQTLENMAVNFRKLGEAATSSGENIGVFKEKWDDVIKSLQERRGLGQAFGRVIRWGFASRTVYGLVSAMQDMVNTMADVELGMAVLRQVMSPLETDFQAVQDAALVFAKQFGLPIRQVIDAMRVFAQQGLAQQEVIDRTRTSMLAANVTTLSTTDATESITAAMKVYGQEGQSTIKFLDAWTEVEARHAITSGDLANALKKAAAVAKTSGITFDELNAIITGIGETSRQTGKEVGTALRFMFRRIQAQKGPKELSKLGIPVLAPTGELRRGFDILGDLAMAWGDLTSSQRLNIAQAIGGRRHYNSLIILMNHWSDVTETLTHSINSKGAAERRNVIVMRTYAKQLEQVRAAVSELQVQFGKAFLPVAKAVLQTVKFMVEAFTNIPTSVKGALVGFSALFALMTKGTTTVQRFMDLFVTGKNVFGEFFGALKGEFQKGIFEVTGREIGGVTTRGLKTFMEAGNVRDLETFLGKMVFMSAKAGRAWNAFLSDLAKGTASTSKGVARTLDFMADRLFNITEFAAGKGGPAGGIVAAISGVLGTATELTGAGFEKVGKMFGFTAQQMALLTRESTGVVGALGPMVGSFFALRPLLEKAYGGFKRLTLSASDYEKSVDGIRRKTSGELADIRELGQRYNTLQKRLEEVNQLREPEARARALEREEYKDPLQELGKVYSDATDFANRLADANISLVSSFDRFGNAVLKSTDDLKSYVDTLTSAQIAEMLSTELDVLGKYVEDLTKTTGMETFKSEFKTLVSEIPVIGEILSRSIKIAPAKELEIITNRMNELITLRDKFPLTTTFDVDIEGYRKKLEKAREAYRATYGDFRRILAELPTEGLAPAQIVEALGRPEFKKGFETILAIEPRLQAKELRGKVTAEDILGAEVLKKIHTGIPLDFTKELTKGLLLQRNVVKREGEAFAGDVVLFTEDVANKYAIAGNQAILSMQKTSEDMVEWTVQYFDKELGRVAEVPFERVEKFVESIFPTMAMQDRMAENIEVLKEFVAGAEAGLRGITQREFKREFNLGARFFTGIPTTTLLQSTKGFEPTQGFGEVAFKQNWDSWIQDNFIKPMTEYRLLLEQISKMQLETGEALLAPGLREDIEKLQNILKNNQVVIQYRAAHEDLMKVLSESQRVLKENIEAERNRSKFIVQSSGYLKGFAEDFSDINTGVQKFADLTAQQRLASREGGGGEFTSLRQAFREDSITRESLVTQMNELSKTLIAIGEITDIAKGFGAALPTEELDRYIEEVAKTGEKGTGLLLGETKNITSNTAQTVARLDEILAQGGDKGAIERLMDRIPSLSDIFSRQLLPRTVAGSVQERLGNVDYAGFAKAMERVQPGITKTKEFTDLSQLQQEQRDKQIVSNKTLSQLLAVYSTFEHFNKKASNKQIDQLDNQIGELKEQRKESKDQGVVAKLTEQIDELTTRRESAAVRARGQATRELIAPIAIASQELAKSLGFTEQQIRVLGGSVAGTYAAWKLWSKLTGEPVPEYLEELGKKSEEAVKRMTQSGFTGKAWRGWYGIKDLIFGKDLETELKKAEETIRKERIFTDEEIKKAQEDITRGAEKSREPGARKTTPLRDKVDAAIQEMKRRKSERGSTTEEKTLSENEAQTGILHGIFEQVKETAANTRDFTESLHGEMKIDRGERREETDAVIKNVENLRKSYLERQGIVADPFRKVIGALLAATATGYLAEKRGGVGRISELEARAEKQLELVDKIITTYPDVVAKAMDEFKSRVEVAGAEAPIETEEVKLAVDVAPFEEEMVNRLENLRGRMSEELEKLNEDMQEAADQMARMELAEEMRRQMEQIEEAIRASKIAQELEDALNREISGVAAGARRPQVAFGERDITNLEPLFRLRLIKRFRDRGIFDKLVAFDKEFTKTMDKEMAELGHIMTFSAFKKDVDDVTKAFERESAEREILINTSKEMAQELALLEMRQGDLTDVEQERYEMLENNLGKVSDRVNNLNESLQDMAKELQKAAVAEELRMESVKSSAQLAAGVATTRAGFVRPTGRGGLPANIPTVATGARFPRELSPEQRAYSESRGARSLIRKYAEEEIRVQGLTRRYEELAARRAELKMRMMDEVKTLGEVTEVTEREFKIINYQMEEAGDQAEEAADKFSKLSDKLSLAVEAARLQIEAEQRMADALKGFYETAVRAKFGALPFGDLGKLGIGPEAFGEIPTGKSMEELTVSQYIYAKSIEDSNDKLRQNIELYQGINTVRQAEIDSLIAGRQRIIEYKEQLDKAYEDADYEKINNLRDAIEKQKEANDKLLTSIESLNEGLTQLGNIQVAMILGGVVQEFERMKKSFQATEALENFKQLGEGFEQIVGGRHPLAPVTPRYEFLKAGVPPEDLFNLNKYEGQMADLVASRRLISGEDLMRIKFQKKIDLINYEQAQENEKLMRQRAQADQLFSRLYEGQQEALELEDPEERRKALTALNQAVIELREQYKEARKELEETTPEGATRYMGFALEGVMKPVEEALREVGISLEDSPVVQQLIQSNNYLEDIVTNTSGLREKDEGSILGSIIKFFSGGTKDKQKKAPGGSVVGPGGPTSDSVPIWASSGEYVIKASSSRNLGKSALDYMNATGELPSFAEGGKIMPTGSFKAPKSYTATTSFFSDKLKEKRDRWLKGEEGPTTFESSMAKLYPAARAAMPWYPWEVDPSKFWRDHPNLYGAAGAVKMFTPALEAEETMKGSEVALASLITLGTITRGKLAAKAGKGIYKGGKKGIEVAKDILQNPLIKTKFGKLAKETGSFSMLKPLERTNIVDRHTNLGKLQARLKEINRAGYAPYISFNQLALRDLTDEHVYKAANASLDQLEEVMSTVHKALGPGQFRLKTISIVNRIQAKRMSGPFPWQDLTKAMGFYGNSDIGLVTTFLKGPKLLDSQKRFAGIYSRKILQQAKETMTHELGHAFAQSKRGARYLALIKKKASERAPETFFERVGKPSWASKIPGIHSKYSSRVRQRLGLEKFPYISEYAKESPSEYLAEMFKQAFHTPRSKASAPVKLLKDVFKIEYQKGTPFVPSDQLALLHRGEAVVPAEYNLGGIVGAPKFQAGGAVNALQNLADMGEQIGDAIVRKLEDTQLSLETTTVSLDTDVVTLDTSDLESILADAGLDNLAGAVGADAGDKLSEIAEKLDSELRKFDTQIVENADNIQRIDDEIIKIYSKPEQSVDLASERSRLEAKLHELVTELKTADLTPLASEVASLKNRIADNSINIDDLRDLVNATSILSGMRGS
jgi:TP901 family phage tail tape measure protein